MQPTENGEAPRIPVAMESDGSDRSRALSVRERSRLIPQQLERAGWNYVSLWSVEVFTDPQTVASLVQRYLGLNAKTKPAAPVFREQGSAQQSERSEDLSTDTNNG